LVLPKKKNFIPAGNVASGFRILMLQEAAATVLPAPDAKFILALRVEMK
jgi:hypothetical protein